VNDGMIKIILALIGLLGTIITYIVIPYIKSKTTKEQRESVVFWVQIAVNAAEQIYIGEGQGKDKKQYVIELLNSKGIQITEDQLDVLIEAAVFEMNKIKTE